MVGAPEAAKAQPAPAITVHPNEVEAIGWAFDALLKYPESERPYIRMAYLPWYSDPEWHGVLNLAVNSACGHSALLCKADIHAGGYVMAWNLRRLCPDPVALARLIGTWDEIAVRDSVFHLPQATFEEITDTVQVPTGRVSNGKPVTQPQSRTRKVQRSIAFLAPHLQAAIARHASDDSKSQRIDVLVTQLTKSTGAIYPAEFLLEQLLTSARGKYPEFRQMDFQTSPHTPLQTLLQKRGYFLETSKSRAGLKGAILIGSDVSGKNRLEYTAYGLASGMPLAIVFDFKDGRTAAEQRFLRNLLEPELVFDASEVFIPLPNGLIEFVLADNKGNLQRVAPPDVVADFTKPDGHTKELEMGMSCVMCHFPDNGYKTLRNDVELLAGSDADFFGDAFTYRLKSGRVISRDEAVAIVAGQFSERVDDPDGVLGRARRDYIKAINQLTSYPLSASGQSSVQLVGQKTKEIYHGYRYRRLDARQILRERGIDCPEELALKTLRQLVPSPAAGEQEDILIALARNGAKILRDDMDAINPELSRRMIVTRPEFAKSIPVASSN